MSTLQDKISQLSPERQKRVLAHGQELIADEMTLRELSQALNITQELNLSLAYTVVRILQSPQEACDEHPRP